MGEVCAQQGRHTDDSPLIRPKGHDVGASFLQWHSLSAKGSRIYLTVAYSQFLDLPPVTNIFADDGKSRFDAQWLARAVASSQEDAPHCQYELYRFAFPLDQFPSITSLKFYFTISGVDYRATNITTHFRFPISEVFKSAYCVLNGCCLQVKDDTLIVRKRFSYWLKEFAFLFEILKKHEGFWKEELAVRIVYWLYHWFKFKPIWLLKDRSDAAGDNAEALFEYLCQSQSKIKPYFVINKKCRDAVRLRKIGRVVHFGSLKHRLLNVLSSVALSSQVDSWLFFSDLRNHALRNIIALKPFVFLQHGITKDDVSDLFGKYEQNISGFVTAAHNERTSILENAYGYTQDEVWLTGFPRYDKLYDARERIITFMPTWRQWLFSKPNAKSGVWKPLPGFTESDYFKFYNSLLNHPRLCDAAQQYGYRLAFFPHPMIRLNQLESCFQQTALIPLPSDISYQSLYARSALLVTDYSSAVFDFAYLRKPVVYTHFDHKAFFSGKHTFKKGYFDYERDGFGEVTYSLEETVDCLINYMKTDCQLKEIYRERVDTFFAFNDRKSCQRVYERVCEMLSH